MAITLGMLHLLGKAMRGLAGSPAVPRRVLSLGYPDIVAAPSHFADFFGADLPARLEWRADSAQIVRYHNAGAVTDRIVDSEQFFRVLGFELEIVDIAEIRGGERILDLNDPCPPSLHGRYGIVIDAGTCEHVFNIGQAAKNVAQMTAPGGYVLSCASLSMFNHAFYNLSPTWYMDFYGQNGFEVVALYSAQHADPTTLNEVRPYQRFGTAPDNSMILMLARRLEVRDIVWPMQHKYRAMTSAAPARPASPPPAAAPASGPDTQTPEPSNKPPAGVVVKYASFLVETRPAKTTRKRRDALRARFDALGPAPGGVPDVFVFHAQIRSVDKVEYRDTRYDPVRDDYGRTLATFIGCVRDALPGARVILASDAETPFDAGDIDGAHLVRLPIDANAPMYERVVAMNAFVHSRAFAAPVLFLDSDAFVNRPLGETFGLRFDVAVTVRSPLLGLMPLNEGVILAKAERPAAIRGFFDRYLATYDRLCGDATIREYYGDIRRWRGGQLALNAVCAGAAPFNSRDIVDCGGAMVRGLPCIHFNHSCEHGKDLTSQDVAQAYVVHLKGVRKDMLDRFHALRGRPDPVPCAG